MNRFLSAVLVSWLLAAREPSLRTGIEAEAAVLLEFIGKTVERSFEFRVRFR